MKTFKVSKIEANTLFHITSLSGIYSFETRKIGRFTYGSISAEDARVVIGMDIVDDWVKTLLGKVA